MGRQPYRVGGERSQGGSRKDEARLDPMALWMMAFVLGCALVRLGVCAVERAFDDDALLALIVGAAAAWGLGTAWNRRRRGA